MIVEILLILLIRKNREFASSAGIVKRRRKCWKDDGNGGVKSVEQRRESADKHCVGPTTRGKMGGEKAGTGKNGGEGTAVRRNGTKRNGTERPFARRERRIRRQCAVVATVK